jgi:ribulose-phosphate 3-epimerase
MKSKKRRVIIAPSILSADFTDLRRTIRQVERAGCLWLHLDVMDGHFVPNITFGPPLVESIRKQSERLFLDAHLMIEYPVDFVVPFVRAGVQSITIHGEACEDIEGVIHYIRKHKAKVGISIKPKTALASIEPVLHLVDMVLVMTVDPGFGGQDFIPQTLNKVRRLTLRRQAKKHDFLIEVDGGINVETAPLVVAAGADVLVAGHSIFSEGDVVENIRALRKSAEGAL